MLGQRRPGDAPVGVRRLTAAEDQVVVGDLAHRGGEHGRGGEAIAAGQRRILDQHRLVGAGRERLLHPLAHVLGIQAEQRHAAAVLVLELQRRLQRALVVGAGEQRHRARGHETLAGLVDPVQAGGCLGIGDPLDADDNVHAPSGQANQSGKCSTPRRVAAGPVAAAARNPIPCVCV